MAAKKAPAKKPTKTTVKSPKAGAPRTARAPKAKAPAKRKSATKKG